MLGSSEPSAVDKLETMMALSAMMNSALEKSDVRERAILAASNLVNCEATSLLFVNEETGGLYFDVALGDAGKELKTIQLERGQGIAGWVAEHNKPIIIKDAQQDPRLYKQADEKSGFYTRNMLCVPIRSNTTTLGVLQALNKRNGAFSKEDARLLFALANQIGVVLENLRLYDGLRDTLYSVVGVLVDVIEKHDPYATGHAKRVASYCKSIGKGMGLSKHDMVNLKLAALLHDVGMVGVPDAITHKKARLTEQEHSEVMKHIGYSEEILSNVKHLQAIIPAVRYHHEHWNGTGYFQRAGERIPLFSRIIAVADAFDSMTTERPYDLGKGYDGALKHLEDNAGVLYDPDIVNLFVNSKAPHSAKRHPLLIQRPKV